MLFERQTKLEKKLKNFVLLFTLVNVLSWVGKTCCFNMEESAETSSSEGSSESPSDNDEIPSPSHIIDGKKAGEHEFPYIVAVRQKKNPKLHFGAGSILAVPGSEDSRWIITAGHLPGEIQNPPKPKLIARELVVYPKYNSNWRNLAKNPQYKVKNAYCHPWPKSQPLPYDDIALLELDSKIPLNKPKHNFKSIKLVDKKFDTISRNGIKVAGWGLNQTRPVKVFDYLLKVDLNIYPTSTVCGKLYQNFAANKWFCAGFYKDDKKMKTICDGDSGGPGVSRTSPGKEVLLGVAIGGNPSCTKPAVFANISYYRDWIENVMTTRPKKMLCKNLLKNRPA